MSTKDARRLIPYIKISKPRSTSGEKLNYEEKSLSNSSNFIHRVDINLADTNAFISLPGIGNKLAARIIKFRDKLRGFYSVEQVRERYNLPDSTFMKIKPMLLLGEPRAKKININTSSVDEMKLHPYLSYNIANAIFQYRKQHGTYQSVEKIKKIVLVSDEIFGKAAPYLTVN
jgi:DNA uptake protein ComE-like DNA-binding protein